MKTAPDPPQTLTGEFDSDLAWQRTIKRVNLVYDRASRIEATWWTPVGGTSQVYRLQRDSAVTIPVPKAPTPQASSERRGFWSWFFWIAAIGIAATVLRKSYQWITGSTSPLVGRRRIWADDVVRLLILMARLSRKNQTLRDRERSLIKNIAISEAKRPNAPGEPTILPVAEAEAIIRGYENECPGVAELVEFLAEARNSPLRMRLSKRVWQIVACDGSASEAEVVFVEQFAQETGMTEAESLAISRRFHRPAPPPQAVMDARSLIELPASATVGEIKRAYKRKAREYHPDAYAGVSENLKRLAAEQFSMPGEAREILIALLGGERLVARDVAGKLVPVENLPEKVCCFICDAVYPTDKAGEVPSARCPRCLALLYHEREFAAELGRRVRKPSATG